MYWYMHWCVEFENENASQMYTTVRHLRRQCQSQGLCSGRTPCARTNVDETRRVVLGSLGLLNGVGCCVVQYRVAVVDSPENHPSCERLC